MVCQVLKQIFSKENKGSKEVKKDKLEAGSLDALSIGHPSSRATQAAIGTVKEWR